MKGITTSRLIRPLIGLALIAGLSAGQVANAAMINVTAASADKTFALWGLNWTADFNAGAASNGTVSYNDACVYAADCATPTVGASITGDNSGGGASYTEMYADAPVAGSVKFDWSYQTTDAYPADPLNPASDPLFFINGGFFELTGSCASDGSVCSGTTGPVAVIAGLLSFGLSIDSIDGLFGPASVAISNFVFLDADGRPLPSPVPVPAAFLLFGTALAGLGFMRKKKAVV